MQMIDTRENFPHSIAGYSQGGTVVDSVAYFTANSYQEMADPGKVWQNERPMPYPFAASFCINSFKKIRTYDFEDTYDSTPIVLESSGRMIIAAHQYKAMKTSAFDVQTGEKLWDSPANQGGALFFGYSYYHSKKGLLLIVCSDSGLHALDALTGREEWFFPSPHGVTPCVDQGKGRIYYQYNGGISILDASSGLCLSSLSVDNPAVCISWNTVLAGEGKDKRIVTYWYEKGFFGSCIRVYDMELKFIWEKKGIPASRKATLCCADAKIFIGSGDHWQQDYIKLKDQSWKTISAYDLYTGKTAWLTSMHEYEYSCIPNIIYCNGWLIAESQTNICGFPYLVFVLNAKNGEILRLWYRKGPANSCAPPVFSSGMLLSGDLISDNVLVTRLGEGENSDWIGAFGDGQTHSMTAPDYALTNLY